MVVFGYVVVWFLFSGGFELFVLVLVVGFVVLVVIWWCVFDWEVLLVVVLVGFWGIYGMLVFGVEVIE